MQSVCKVLLLPSAVRPFLCRSVLSPTVTSHNSPYLFPDVEQAESELQPAVQSPVTNTSHPSLLRLVSEVLSERPGGRQVGGLSEHVREVHEYWGSHDGVASGPAPRSHLAQSESHLCHGGRSKVPRQLLQLPLLTLQRGESHSHQPQLGLCWTVISDPDSQ